MISNKPVRLTTFSPAAGCGCKLSAPELAEVLRNVPGAGSFDERLLVGSESNDDAAVYKVNDTLAIVVTTDFFTPIVDDAYDWGRIAATNAISDVFAMGGKPLLALNIVAWPREKLPLELLTRVLLGGNDVAAAHGCLVVGGHTIDDATPKYGMAVVGTVHPDRILSNTGAQAGDQLILTKPLGVGAITTSIKRGGATVEQIRRVTDLMTTSNDGASTIAAEFGFGASGSVHAGTDVTGFGLVGHLLEMLLAANLSAELELASVPYLAGTEALLANGVVAGGTVRNFEHIAQAVDWGAAAEWQQLMLSDAQTSGGLLLSCAPEVARDLQDRLRVSGLTDAGIIGTVTDCTPSILRVR